MSSGTWVPPIFLLCHFGSVVPMVARWSAGTTEALLPQSLSEAKRGGVGGRFLCIHLILVGREVISRSLSGEFSAVQEPTLKIIAATDNDFAMTGLVLSKLTAPILEAGEKPHEAYRVLILEENRGLETRWSIVIGGRGNCWVCNKSLPRRLLWRPNTHTCQSLC